MAHSKALIRFLADGGATAQPSQIPNSSYAQDGIGADQQHVANPGTFGGMGDTLMGGGPTASEKLKAAGYTPYQETAGPNVSGDFNGYTAQNANTSANNPYLQAQQGLLGQLQAQASGTGGPTTADQQLQQGIGASLAAQRASAAGARGQNAGLASAQLGNQLANTTAGAAGQAGAQRAQEQQNAQGALGGLTQGAIGQGNQLAENNQAAQNQAALYGANAKESYGNLQNQNWQYGNNLNAQQQSQYNAMIGSMEGAGSAGQAAGSSAAGMSGLSSIGSGISNIANVAADGGVFGMDDGGVVDSSQAGNFPGGGAGGGGGSSGGGGGSDLGSIASAIGTAASIAAMFMADGGVNGVDIPSQATNFPHEVSAPKFSSAPWYDSKGSKGGGSAPAPKPIVGNGTQPFTLNPSNPDQALSPGLLQSQEAITPNVENSTLQDPSQFAAVKPMGGTDSLGVGSLSQPMADGGFSAPPPPPSQFDLTGPGGGIGGGTGYDPTARMGSVRNMAEGGVAAPVANGPTKAIIGENGPEAVVPIKPNGDVDPARARNPGLQALLDNHPALRHIQPSGAPAGQPAGTSDRAVAAALAQAGAHLSDRVANLEATISHLAKRNQRRAA